MLMIFILLSLLSYPTQNVAVSTTSHSVVLTWNSSPSPNITYYKVFRSTKSGTGYTQKANVNALTYTDTNVTAGKTYYYVVQAFCKKCDPQTSVNSNQAQATIP